MKYTRILKICGRLLLCGLCIGVAGCKRDAKRQPHHWINPPSEKIAGLQHKVIVSQHEGTKVGVSILLPEDYKQHPQRHYSVIYYLHGSGGHESSEVAGVQHLVKNAVNSKDAMPIIVFPNGGRSGYFGPTEYMIVEEIIPFIEKSYRVKPSREGRNLLGFSMGGTASVRLALKYPQIFKSAVSLGGRLWHGDESIPSAISKNAEQLKALDVKLMFIQGEQDGPEQFNDIISKLIDADISVYSHRLPGTSHDLGVYIESSVPLYADFLKQLPSTGFID